MSGKLGRVLIAIVDVQDTSSPSESSLELNPKLLEPDSFKSYKSKGNSQKRRNKSSKSGASKASRQDLNILANTMQKFEDKVQLMDKSMRYMVQKLRILENKRAQKSNKLKNMQQ
jgi:hypothetical protein